MYLPSPSTILPLPRPLISDVDPLALSLTIYLSTALPRRRLLLDIVDSLSLSLSIYVLYRFPIPSFSSLSAGRSGEVASEVNRLVCLGNKASNVITTDLEGSDIRRFLDTDEVLALLCVFHGFSRLPTA